ncbi:hypothetical protein PGTUg99_033805 [Puccinia graminis f. sp. tritici]|uniref:Uncharacterized protein n=1 Tax=Puccinia graminis f. sp. tritici TaxID=56615 RepID=A0A5B0R7Q8_PUCGR|nr:hypothetical protein PGTUg99_033805 [Puccinia graminis f. sp. tritici]
MGFTSARIHDVRTGTDLGNKVNFFEQEIAGHGSLIVQLTETKEAPKRDFQRIPAAQAELISPAHFRQVGELKVATSIKAEGQGAVVWHDVPGSQDGHVLLSFDYINAELPSDDEDHAKLNFKRAAITINDDPHRKFQVHFPITGMTWSDVYPGYLVSLPLPNAKNKVRIEGLDGAAPDFVALSVAIQPAPTTTKTN